MMFCLKTVKDNSLKSDICSQWGKDPVPSRSSSDSDCASPPDLDTSAVCVPRKMKVWLSHNKLTHASSALAGTCTAVTMWWHSLLCNNPSATSLCSLGSHRSLCSCAPTATVTCAGQGKAATERELLCGPGSVCSAVPSAVLSAPDAQQPSMIPAQGALRPALGWQRGEEAGPSAPFLLWMLGSSCHGGWTGCWRGLWWGCLSSNNFPFIPAVSFQLLTIAKVPFGVWFVLGFFFRTGCSSLISAVQNYYSWLEKRKLWLSLLQLYCWSCGCCRGPSARKLRGSRRLEGTFLNTSLSWGR